MKTRLLGSKNLVRFLSVVLAIAFVIPVLSISSIDVSAAQGSYHVSNIGTASAGNVLVALDGTFDPVSLNDILNRINEYRYEACTDGNVPDPRNTSRMLTESDYVPIKWSTLLEEMAMLRAAEASINYSHTRPNGTSCFTASYGVSSWNEVLAWYGGLLSGMGGWYSEKSAWVNQTGAVTGHYTAMINPNNRYCGISCFNGSAAGEFTSSTAALDQTKIDVSQYSGQYLELSGSKIVNYSLTGASQISYSGGQTTLSLIVDFTDTNAWGNAVTKTGLRVVDAGWVSDNTGILTVNRAGVVSAQGVAGTATMSLTLGSNNITHTVTATDRLEMYRLYNPNSGEHFYTASESERNMLVGAGWNYEGIAWYAPISGLPVYRLYNRYAGDHHYTMDYAEVQRLVDLGWTYENIGWYSAGNTGTPLYRLYNPNCTGAGSHHYTINNAESSNLQSFGWRYEGIGWYGA